MKKITITLVLLLLSTSVFAWTIGPMNYQGRLLDAAGIPVTGSYTFKVRIYDAASGGTLKFAEQHNSVAVDDGVYAILVSTGSTLSGTWDINLWNTPTLYLEAEVNGQTLTPRHLLAATPFAYQANLALTTNNALALGGVSASQYQNTLADICVSGKGKWLDLVQKCLGIGAAVTNQSATALSSNLNYKDLDLSKADITGSTFANADFSGTVFKDTKLTISGFSTANLTGAILDGVISSAGGALTTNFTNAKISNVNMVGWNLTGSILTGASIVDLIACPSNLPAGFSCKQQNNNKYLIIGPNLNFSETSLMKGRLDSQNLATRFFDYANLPGANFKGNKIESWWVQGANYAGANFEQTSIHFAGVETSNLDNTSFVGSSLRNVVFSQMQSMNNVNFYSSDLTHVIFLLNSAGTSVMGFDSAILQDVRFEYSAGSSLELTFSNSNFINSAILAATTQVFTEDASFTGGFYLGDQVTGVSINNGSFMDGNIGGNWRNAGFYGGSFINVSFNGADFTGATGMGDASYTNANWYGAKCPDAYQVTTLTGTCVGHFLP